MALPTPRPGLVIRYAYLWRDEADQGREEGVKDRPCVVVLTVQQDDDAIRVRVAPVTHNTVWCGHCLHDARSQTIK